MTPNPATCRPTESAAAAARIMWERDCGAVPVVDQGGHAIGMITDRDLCMAAYLRGVRIQDITIDSVMAHSAVTCSANDRLDDAGHRMAEARVRRLPVVDAQGVVCGVLSINDIVRARARDAPSVDGILRTIARISEPRHHDVAEAE